MLLQKVVCVAEDNEQLNAVLLVSGFVRGQEFDYQGGHICSSSLSSTTSIAGDNWLIC